MCYSPAMIKKVVILSIVLIGCGSDPSGKKIAEDNVKGGADGKSERWGSGDDPRMFSNDLEYRLAELPQNAEIPNIPWAGNYWPTYQDNINYKWDGDNPPPSTKYGQAFGVEGIEDAVSRDHGIDSMSWRTACDKDADCNADLVEKCAIRDGKDSGYCVPTWFGICHAWAPAAILVPEPEQPVTHNGVDFAINDIKALITLAYDRTNTRFVSLRCNLQDIEDGDEAIAWDSYGRPTDRNPECRDTNPGTWHVLMTNYLGIQGQSFVYDRTFDAEVWNQPLRGYRTLEQREVTPEEANRLIGVEDGPSGNGQIHTFDAVKVSGRIWNKFDPVDVTPGTDVTVEMIGDSNLDADLYVRWDAEPTLRSFDCESNSNDADESCTLVVPAGASEMYVGVRWESGATGTSVAIEATVGTVVETEYAFNPDAKSLYYIRSDVDFIAESPASRDGNLASDIDRYTHEDNYEYILELDADGKIIGGEWIGASKNEHPDFLWLPTSHRGSTTAEGKIRYSNVKTLLDLSIVADNNTGTGEEVTVDEADTVKKGEWKHFGPYHVAPGTTLTANLSGDADADLYVRKGSAPSALAYDCRPYRSDSDESCSVVGGEVYVSVQGYSTTTDFSLNIKYIDGSGEETPIEPVDTITHLDESGSLGSGESKIYTLDVLAGEKVYVRTFSSSDMDLYIQMNQDPTTSAYLSAGYTASGDEVVTITPQSNGKLHIMVLGYNSGSYKLTTAAE